MYSIVTIHLLVDISYSSISICLTESLNSGFKDVFTNIIYTIPSITFI